MRGLHRNLLASVSLIALSTEVLAGDWSGFYAGFNAGVTGRKAEFVSEDGFFGDKLTAPRGAGGIVGAQFGYNWQQGNLVYGLETDFGWADGSSKDERTSSKLSALTSARARVGFALPAMLIYATGGFSTGRIQSTALSVFSSEGWRQGWVFGGGIEHMFASNLSIRFEGLQSDFGSGIVSGEACGVKYRTRFSHSESTVRGALSLKW